MRINKLGAQSWYLLLPYLHHTADKRPNSSGSLDSGPRCRHTFTEAQCFVVLFQEVTFVEVLRSHKVFE